MTEAEAAERMGRNELRRGRVPYTALVERAMRGEYFEWEVEGGKAARKRCINFYCTARRMGMKPWIARSKVGGQWFVWLGPHAPKKEGP